MLLERVDVLLLASNWTHPIIGQPRCIPEFLFDPHSAAAICVDRFWQPCPRPLFGAACVTNRHQLEKPNRAGWPMQHINPSSGPSINTPPCVAQPSTAVSTTRFILSHSSPLSQARPRSLPCLASTDSSPLRASKSRPIQRIIPSGRRVKPGPTTARTVKIHDQNR